MKHKPKLSHVILMFITIGFCILFYNCTFRNNISLNKNNLGTQTSLYLLQHANNPVNWQPWNSTLYKSQNKPAKLLIISVGYSSCHWCHVMEKETFENQAVASLMNKHFINIKIDREEHPDVDKIYMTALQLMTGNGGWPLNVICLPDGRPVYAGSYHTQTQWTEVLAKIQKIYQDKPKKLETLATSISDGIISANMISKPQEALDFDKNFFNDPIKKWIEKLDFLFGGELQDQKFINPVKLRFLNAYQWISSHPKLREYLDTSLMKIATGGIYDAIDGGVFRYAVDSKWEIPHFEKMLYDNAQFLALYAEAYKQQPKALYKEVIEETIRFLNAKMKDPNGGFYAAIDADNKEGEGRYYTFSATELERLSYLKTPLFYEYYHVDMDAPFEEDLYTLKKGCSDAEFIKKHKLSFEAFDGMKKEWQAAINVIIAKRDHPQIDKKIITSWNALTITGLVKASQALGNKEYLNDAEDLFTFLTETIMVSDTLYHTLQNKMPKVKAFLDDYASLAEAALLLYKTTGKETYLEWSQIFIESILDKYEDKNSDLFVYKMTNPLLTDIVEITDGVIPSANAQIAHTLYDLGELLSEKKYTQRAVDMMQSVLPFMEQDIRFYSHWAALLLKMTFPRYEVVINGPKAFDYTAEIQRNPLVNVLIQQCETESDLPLLRNRFISDQTLIYVCQNKVCYSPDDNPKDALERLKALREKTAKNDNGAPFLFNTTAQ